MEISITKASQEWGISRVTLHKKIKEGLLSKQTNGTLESSEMLRVFGEPKVKVSSESDVNVYRDLQLRIQHLESDLQLQKELTRKGEEREAWLQSQVGNLTDTMKLLDAPKSKNPGTWQLRLPLAACVVVALVVAGMFALHAANYI